MATTKKTTKPKAKASSKAKPKSSSIKSTIKTAAKSALIPGYGILTAVKKLDDYIQKKDPNLSKSKAYSAAKKPAKKVKGTMDYLGDKAISFAKGAAAVATNPGKYIEKGAAKVGKAAKKGMKAVDDYIEKVDPNLAKSKSYKAIKGVAKKAPKAIETSAGVAGKTAAMVTPASAGVVGREIGKGVKAVGKYAKEKIKKGAKAADDYIEKKDPNLSKSKAYGAVKSVAKSALGVKSGSTAKKATSAKSSAAKSSAKTTTKAASAKTTPAKTTTTTKKSAPTVSELWKQKTGTSWSEAKKLGLSDGSASSNIALMKKLQSGSVNKNTVKAAKSGSAASMKKFEKEMNKNVQDELSGKTTYEPPTTASKSNAEKAADENKMRRGGMVKRKLKAIDDKIEKRYPNYTGKGSNYQKAKNAAKGVKVLAKTAIKSTPEYKAYKAVGKLAKKVDDKLEKRYPNRTKKGTAYSTVKKAIKSVFGYKTGGMVTSKTKAKSFGLRRKK